MDDCSDRMTQIDIDDSLKPIRARFISALVERQAEIVASIEAAMKTPEQEAVELQRIEAILHKIAGTAGTLGFADLGDRAHVIESCILTTRLADRNYTADLWSDILDWVEMSMDVLERAA